ncbi:MAG: BrnT family toxin [Candidatus Doudnabacteria bacterium]|nr:BrnT family toxin [Candidatus Doudnabacteria bacterium]
MKFFEWDAEKNARLKAERDVSFEEVVIAVSEGKLLDLLRHPNKKKYPGQRILVVEINNYAYLVPFIEDEQRLFLKTIIPSRKATRDYIIKRK